MVKEGRARSTSALRKARCEELCRCWKKGPLLSPTCVRSAGEIGVVMRFQGDLGET